MGSIIVPTNVGQDDIEQVIGGFVDILLNFWDFRHTLFYWLFSL